MAGLTWWALPAHRGAAAPAAASPTVDSSPAATTELAAPPDRPAPVHAAAASAAPRLLDPRQACEGRNFISKEICLARQCLKPAYSNHAECVKQREYRTQRERFGH